MQIRMDEKGRILFMATYVISDIHGEYERFMELLEEIDLYVSRRAIAKYRSILHIPGSKERKIR